MERHIGLWRNENDNTPEVAELIIDGNHIEFYRRNTDVVFPCAYVGSDDDHKYKIFTNGGAEYGRYKTLNNVASCITFFVLQQNCEYKEGLSIEGIVEASIVIPELIDWLDLKTVDWGATEEKEMIAIENKLPNILLKGGTPKIEIYFETKPSVFNSDIDDRTTVSIDNQPRIKISYGEPVDVYVLRNDIRCIMQFFALMIGHVSDVLDIRLTIQEQDLKSWLYINEDFSYNLRTIGIMERPRTKLKNVQEKLDSLFANWYEFYYDDKFELVRRMYFEGNGRKDIYAQDILVQYVRILEGYHLRITDDEKVASNLDKDIKDMIFTDEGKALFKPIFDKVEWNYNSKHAKLVATWIASGFLLKTTLTQMCNTINVLKALLIMIFYTHMGMTNDEARKIIIWDTELNFQTMFLREDNERPDNI
ncbi:MAG: hypothetical protein PHG07_10010 [Lachnospiraceae bacterium]|nr:hypothetical protein [Lachnospiraceae bacterium]